MINSYEFSKIKVEKLPVTWQDKEVLRDLECFLQENWQQRSIFYSDGYTTSGQQFIDFDKKDGIKLKNYIGTIIYKGGQLNIFPKVFKEEEDDFDTKDLKLEELISNLVFWLSYSDRLNFPFVSMKNELTDSENLMELFITIYVHYVKNAIDKQRFYRYEEVTETGNFVKGKIDFVDYFTKKMPMGRPDSLNYTYSNFMFDNLLNQIIKCTCIFLMNLTNQKENQNIIRNILIKLSNVKQRNCMPYDCDQVHLSMKNSQYNIILNMSKMFLLNKINSQNIGYTDAFCFLFPAELLFEGFVGGFIKDIFKTKAKVRTQASDQYLAELIVDGESFGNVFQLKEDILIEYNGNIIILDTKYKEIEKFSKVKENKKLKVSDNDMKQMAIYAIKRGAKKLYLIYPLHKNEALENIEIRYDILLNVKGQHSRIPLEIVKIPFLFLENKKRTIEILTSIFDKMLI